MITPKHTPKPWRYDPFGGMIWSTVPTVGGVSRQPANFRLADVRGWGHLQYNDDGKAVQDANGVLLAAAPVLFDALAQLQLGECLSCGGNALPYGMCDCRPCSNSRIVQAALREATAPPMEDE